MSSISLSKLHVTANIIIYKFPASSNCISLNPDNLYLSKGMENYVAHIILLLKKEARARWNICDYEFIYLLLIKVRRNINVSVRWISELG